MSALHDQRYRFRRVAQTPRTFANWPQILSQMALERCGRGPDELTFRTRSGLVIATPNRPGARVPVYEIFAEDSYRFAWFLGPLLERPIQVLDIGGHVGAFTCGLTQLHREARVQAFEPSATTARFLRRNTAQNGFSDRVDIVESAMSSRSGVAIFDDNGAGSGLNGLRSTGHNSGTGVEVETVSFDETVASAPAPVDLVKIDCEGGEYDLVLGSAPESWTHVSRVVVEHHPVAGHSWGELEAFFATVGLTVQDVENGVSHGCVWLSREPLPAYRV